MEVIFIKDHPVGIKKGRVLSYPKNIAEKLIEDGYCEDKNKKKAQPKEESKKKSTKKNQRLDSSPTKKD